MKIATVWSTDRNLTSSVGAAYDSLTKKLGQKPDIIFAHFSATADVELIGRILRERAPSTPIHGSTSCLGIMTEEGFHSDDGFGIGLLGISDPDGSYGVGAAPLGEDSGKAAQRALENALEQAGCAGAVPAMVWITGAPGTEEEVIRGIEDYLGPNVPVAGGSSADNAVAGEWKELANGEVQVGSVVATVLFPSTEVYFSFHSGYEPTDRRGRITRADGRTIYEIDGRPAAEVYDEWTKGELSQHLRGPGNILAHTTLYPLGREVGSVAGVSNYQLSHPHLVLEQGALSLFTAVEVGDEFVLMEGTHESLTTRAGRVANAALKTYGAVSDQAAGALIIYCAGCMLTVREKMSDVVSGLRQALGGKPFLGSFTFGEQGCFVGGANRHGNLMISVLVFTA